MQSKLDLIEKQDPLIAEYLRLQNKRLDEIRKYVEKVLLSRKSINEHFSNRLEVVEKKLEGKNNARS